MLDNVLLLCLICFGRRTVWALAKACHHVCCGPWQEPHINSKQRRLTQSCPCSRSSLLRSAHHAGWVQKQGSGSHIKVLMKGCCNDKYKQKLHLSRAISLDQVREAFHRRCLVLKAVACELTGIYIYKSVGCLFLRLCLLDTAPGQVRGAASGAPLA